MWEWLLEGIQTRAQQLGAALPLTWLFVAQCNRAPSHASFMGQVGDFFDSAQYPRVTRDETCLVMANVAGMGTPGKAEQFGQSAVIVTPSRFSRPKCMPTYGNGGVPQRGADILENFRDAVFRERGAYPFDGVHYRAPGGAVPAVVKWMNDELDEPSKSLATMYIHLPLTAVAGAAHQRAVGERP